MATSLLLSALMPATAEHVRVATFSTELSRRGPGLLLRDILKGKDEQVSAILAVIEAADPDILLLNDFDYDLANSALTAFAERLAGRTRPYPYVFSLRPNAGVASGLDMNGNGRTGEPQDAQGYGAFAGSGGLAFLSRFPIDAEQVQDLSSILWKDLPDAELPTVDGAPFPSVDAIAIQRLSSTGHWIVPFTLPEGATLTLMAFSATAPVFDGPEDQNGLRNAAEIQLWRLLLDGRLPASRPTSPFVILGKANLDPVDGEGRHAAIRSLLSDPRIQDCRPVSEGGANSGSAGHAGDPGLDTADWREASENGPGNLRVDYVLPSADLTITGCGVHWPKDGPAAAIAAKASRNHLVWADIVIDP